MTDDPIRIALQSRLVEIDKAWVPMTEERNAVRMALAGDKLSLAEIAVVGRLIASLQSPPAAAEEQAPLKRKLRQNEKGSSAWGAGRAARTAAGGDVTLRCTGSSYPEGSKQEEGYRLGWEERDRELVPPPSIPEAEGAFHQRLVEATTLRIHGDQSADAGEVGPIIESTLRLK